MIEITQDKVDVLSKLYNLRGEDSIVLDRIKREIENTENTKTEVTTNKVEQEDLKLSKENELESFINDEQRALEDFKSLEKNSYDALSAIGISFDIKEKLSILREEGKKYKDNLAKEINDSEEKISSFENDLESLETKLADQFVELAEANKAKDKLNALLEDILVRQNDSYNRGYVKKLLEELNTFTEEEISDLEMLILFPETGLMQFEKSDKTKTSLKGKTTPKKEVEEKEKAPKDPEKEGQTEVLEKEEPKKDETEKKQEEKTEESKPMVSEPITFNFEEEVISPFQEIEAKEIKFPFEEETPISLEEMKPIELQEETSTPVSTISPTILEEPKIELAPVVNTPLQEEIYDPELESYLISLGLTLPENKEILSKLKGIDKKIIENNRNLLINELEIESTNKILYTNISGYYYLADMDLVNKVNFLRSKGINDKTIKEEIENKNFTCSLDVLKERMRLLEDEKGSTNESLYLLKQDLQMYRKNLFELEQAGLTLDDKERVNFRYLLSEKNIAPVVRILKEYLIMIRKANGKLALNVLNKDPKELALELDKLLETELDELITNYPDILSQKADNIIKRVLYCITNNIEIKTNSNSYMKYIYDAQAFAELVKNRNDAFDIELFDANKVNASIKEILGNNDTVSKLVDVLNAYYSNSVFSPIELGMQELQRYNELMAKAPNLLGVTSTDNERIYKVADKAISINKIQRNCKVLLASHIVAEDKTIILVSALYNLLTDEETIANITETCLSTVEKTETEGM